MKNNKRKLNFYAISNRVGLIYKVKQSDSKKYKIAKKIDVVSNYSIYLKKHTNMHNN